MYITISEFSNVLEYVFLLNLKISKKITYKKRIIK